MKYLLLLSLTMLTSCSIFSIFSSSKSNDEKNKVETTADAEKRSVASLPSPAPRKRLLVVKFSNRSSLGGDELGQYATSYVKEAVEKVPDFILVPQEEIEGYEKFWTGDKRPDTRMILEKARAYGISGVLLGGIEEFSIREKGDEVGIFRTRYHTVNTTIQVQLFDVASERELISKLTSAEITEEHTQFLEASSQESYDAGRGQLAVSKALEKVLVMLPTYAKRIAWAGRIAKVDLHRYYINAGEATGITRGQLLGVYGDGTPVTDQETGLIIGTTPGNFKGVLKIIDYFGRDGAVALIHSGGGFRERDRVEFFSPPQK